jgi:hypothetical protein
VDTHQAADRCGVGTCFRKRPSRFLFCHSFSRTETPVSIDFIPNAFRRSFRRPRRFSLSLFAFRFSLFAASTVSAASSHSSSTTIKKEKDDDDALIYDPRRVKKKAFDLASRFVSSHFVMLFVFAFWGLLLYSWYRSF